MKGNTNMPAKKAGKSLATRAATPARKSGATIVQAAVDITELPSTEMVIEAIREGTQFHFAGENDGSSVLASTLERFVNKGESASLSDLAESSELDATKDHLDEWLTILSIDGINNADPANAGPGTLGVYLVVSYATRDGEIRKMAVGAKSPFGYIVALNEADLLPAVIRFVKAERPTKSGFYPINVEVSETGDVNEF